VSFVVLFAVSSSLEAIWYLGVAQELYQRSIGALMNAQFDVFVAALFYLFYSLGAVVFSVRPALLAGSALHALRTGAMYGFFCFAAHNLTDLADVKGFSALITAIDIAWGTFMTAIASVFAYGVAQRMAKPAAAPVSAAESP
jgi:uncharacterized membrane protein